MISSSILTLYAIILLFSFYQHNVSAAKCQGLNPRCTRENQVIIKAACNIGCNNPDFTTCLCNDDKSDNNDNDVVVYIIIGIVVLIIILIILCCLFGAENVMSVVLLGSGKFDDQQQQQQYEKVASRVGWGE